MKETWIDEETGYTIETYPLLEYLDDRIRRKGLRTLLTSKTDTKYPLILALGICYHREKLISVARVGRWKLRIDHELGHAKGLTHTMKPGYVMHPWGFLRGNKYIKEVDN